ncbi:MAG TPA: hypothetical protein PK803_02695, partial [Alphaproteobacteria bacterium]|nr:hypothetical protein [Alphaproteobacteria bacterium]
MGKLKSRGLGKKKPTLVKVLVLPHSLTKTWLYNQLTLLFITFPKHYTFTVPSFINNVNQKNRHVLR